MTPQKVTITYSNLSKQSQILRISDPRCYLERVLAPKQEIVFEAFADSIVEIYSGEFVTVLLTEKILVSSLHNSLTLENFYVPKDLNDSN